MERVWGNRIRLFVLLVLLWGTVLPLLPRPLKGQEPVLFVAYSQNLPPFSFTDSKGQAAGLHIDLLKAAASRLGYHLEYLPRENATECLQALQTGEADLALSIFDTFPTGYPYESTGVLSTSSLCAMAYTEASPVLQKEKAGRLSASFEYGTVNYTMLRNLDVSLFSSTANQPQALLLQQNQQTDLVIGVKSCLLYLLDKEGLEDRYTITRNHIGSISYVAAAAPENAGLAAAFDEELTILRSSGFYDRLYSQWMLYEDGYQHRRLLKRVLLGAGLVACGGLLYILVNQRLKRLLKKEVAKKTQDLSESKERLEQQYSLLQNQLELRNHMMEASPNGILLFNRDYQIVLANQQAKLLIGRKDLRDLGVYGTPVFGDILLRAAGPGYFQKGERKLTGIQRFEAPGGETLHYRYSILQTAGGALMTVEDATLEEREKHAVFEAEKTRQLNQIVAAIAHEIKNPLTALSASASIIEKQGDNPAFRQAFAEHIPYEINRINRLVASLVQYTRPVQKQAVPLDAAEAVRSALYLIEPMIRKKNFHIEAKAQDNLWILGDGDRIRQVFFNLILNGLESMDKKAAAVHPARPCLTLEVKAWAEGDRILITVRDEGAGMDETTLDRCTQPFYTTKPAGTGIGLALCKQYVEDNQGELFIESRLGEYTRITLKFKRTTANET